MSTQTLFGNATPGSFVTDGTISNASVAAGAFSLNSSTYTNGGGAGAENYGTEFSIAVGYGATISGGPAVIYVCHQVASGYEVTAVAWSFNQVSAPQASTTLARNFSWFKPGNFQVVVGNPSGNSTIASVTLAARPVQGGIG